MPSELRLPRIYMCGSPATDLCPNGTNGTAGVATGPTDIKVKDIDTRSATITWLFGKDKDMLPIARYRLRYGVALDGQGNIASPKETYKDGKGDETTLEQPLGGLAPGTLYYTDVDPTSKGCTATPAPVRTTFTTIGVAEPVKPRGHQGTTPAQLSVQPNPANSTVTVRPSEAGYAKWTLTYANGIYIRGGQVPPDTDLTLDVSALAPGLYIVTFLGGQKPPVGKTFVVQR